MIAAATKRRKSPIPNSFWRAGRRIADPVAIGSLLLAGAGLALIVGLSGTPRWQLIRVATVAASTIWIYREFRTDRPAKSVIGCFFGAVTMPVGLGCGIQYVGKTGLSLGSVAGAMTFLGGSALLVIGACRVLASVRKWIRVPLAVVLLGIVAVSTWVFGQAVAAVNVPRTDLGPATPADMGVAYQDVTFSTPDGVALSGWYIPSKNGAAVALLHGSGSNRSAVLEHAVVLAENGYGVLAFDARGHGNSTGRPMDFGWFGDEDVVGAVSYLSGRADVDAGRIGVVGLSMGGEEAIGAAAADDRLEAVVAEGATSRIEGDKAWLVEEYGWRGVVTQVVDRLMFGVTDLLTDADPPITLRQAAEVTKTPMLLVAAGSVPSEKLAAAHIAAGSPTTVEVWIVPGSDHTGGLRTDPVEWESRVVTFLDLALDG